MVKNKQPKKQSGNDTMTWDTVLKVQKEMETQFETMDKSTKDAYNFNNDLLLLSMYCLIPPLRNEIKQLEITQCSKDNDKNYVYMNKSFKTVVLKLTTTKKGHPEVHFDLLEGRYKSPHLAQLLKESYQLYPRKYLFTTKNSFPYMNKKPPVRALDERLANIFYRHGIQKQITINTLQNLYVVSHASTVDKIDMTIQMRTTIECLDKMLKNDDSASSMSEPSFDFDEYEYDPKQKNHDHIPRGIHKSNPSNQSMFLQSVDSISSSSSRKSSSKSKTKSNNPSTPLNTSMQANSSTPFYSPPDINNASSNDDCKPLHVEKALTEYQRKQEQKRRYYRDHRDEILQKAKEYASKMTAYEKSRARIIALLNNSADYENIMKEKTKKKYRLFKDETTGKWKYHEDDEVDDDDESDEESDEPNS